MKIKFYPLLFLFLFLLTVENSKAVPAFARKYRISCMTCHAPSAPKLKPFGDQFAGDGFQLEDYEAPRYFVNTGDDKLSLIRDFPLAVRMDGFVKYNFSNKEKSDFSAPYLMKLLSGGQLSEHLAYYFYFYMDEHSEVAGVEDAYLMYNNLFGVDLDIYLGQFQVSDPLFKRELRLTLEDYRAYTARVGISEINLTYDKGIMVTYGLPTATTIVAEVVNGNGLADADEWKVFDKDKYKSYMGRVSQDIGGFLRLGGMVYYGKEEIKNASNVNAVNSVLYYGPDATLSYKDYLELNMQYLIRTDDNVYFSKSADNTMQDVLTNGMLGELIYSPKGDQSLWYAAAIYNNVDSDYDPANYQSGTFHLGYLLRRNVRLAAEYTYTFTKNLDEYGGFSVGFVSAF